MRAIFLCLTMLAGCAMQQVDPAITAEAQRPLTCASKQQCDLYWQRAQAYINLHSAYKIQSATDTILVTYGPAGTSRNLAYKLTKIPNADGSATIDVVIACDDYIIGCSPKAPGETISLKRYIRGI